MLRRPHALRRNIISRGVADIAKLILPKRMRRTKAFSINFISGDQKHCGRLCLCQALHLRKELQCLLPSFARLFPDTGRLFPSHVPLVLFKRSAPVFIFLFPCLTPLPRGCPGPLFWKCPGRRGRTCKQQHVISLPNIFHAIQHAKARSALLADTYQTLKKGLIFRAVDPGQYNSPVCKGFPDFLTCVLHL